MDQLGPDGHPLDAGLLPPMRLKRRMWAGGSLRFIAPLRIGDPLHRRSSVRDITEKEGATGPMMLVTVDHAIYGPKGLAIEERQDIVFLDIPDRFNPPKARAQTGNEASRVAMKETLLFRYSALTFNAHRIHYDKAYTTQVEHYPDLVVHGPLQATLLAQSAVTARGRMPSLFEYRGVSPMFVGEDLVITTEETNPATMVLMSGQGGHQGMRATAIWEETQ
jgi:3-methylfumaryl-CoA hydratase